MKIRFYLSLFIARIAYYFLKITKLSTGTAIIGLLTLKICPKFLKYADDLLTGVKINITGTNGKTTTTGIISHLVNKSEKTFLNNSAGANMLNGIVNALALQLSPFKKYDYSIIETDEAFLEKIYNGMNGDYLLVTNLFEDQTDRFANPLVTKSLIQKGIDLKPEVQLILNADEPISSGLKSNKVPIYYGVEDVVDETSQILEDNKQNYECPVCHQPLVYTKKFYSQIGHFECGCGYKRANLKYKFNVVLHKDSSTIKLNEEIFEIPLVGLYNAYNAMGAIVLAKELGLKNIEENILTFKVAFGRSEKRNLYGHDTLIQLIKNPAGTNEVLKTVDLNSNILIAVNNNIADGTDVSWLSQANFEKLAASNKEIVVSGMCVNAVEERLKQAGIKNIKVISEISKAVDYIGKNADNNITVLTTYTALLKIDKIKEMKKCF